MEDQSAKKCSCSVCYQGNIIKGVKYPVVDVGFGKSQIRCMLRENLDYSKIHVFVNWIRKRLEIFLLIWGKVTLQTINK